MYYSHLFKQRELYSNKVISSSVQLTTYDKYKNRDKCLGSSGSLGTGGYYPNYFRVIKIAIRIWDRVPRVRVIRVWVMDIRYFAQA
jgi:hypothetical protein